VARVPKRRAAHEALAALRRQVPGQELVDDAFRLSPGRTENFPHLMPGNADTAANAQE
jgi:hypothetical protein